MTAPLDDLLRNLGDGPFLVQLARLSNAELDRFRGYWDQRAQRSPQSRCPSNRGTSSRSCGSGFVASWFGGEHVSLGALKLGARLFGWVRLLVGTR